MRRINYIIFFLAVVLVSCQRDEVTFTSFNGFTVTSESTINMDKQFPIWADQIGDVPDATDPSDPNGYNQVEGKSTFMQMFSPLINTITYSNVHQIAGTYTSEYKGKPIILSGKIYVPKSGKVKGLVLACHYTYAALSESPSQNPTLSALLATAGFAVVDADYVGFGVTYQMVHPYLDKVATARAVADLGVRARPFLEANGYKFETDDVYIFGYSQGGHAATCVQWFIESHPDYLAKLPLKKVFCGGGPYDPKVTYDVAKTADYIGFPSVVPMFLQGTIYAQDLDTAMTEADFLSDSLLVNNRYKQWLNSKAYTMDQVNILMKSVGCGKFSTILRPEALDNNYPKNITLFEALSKNATTDYAAKTPMYIFHSTKDDVVPIENAYALQRSFHERGADENQIEYDFADYGSHRSGLLKFHLRVLKMMKKL